MSDASAMVEAKALQRPLPGDALKDRSCSSTQKARTLRRRSRTIYVPGTNCRTQTFSNSRIEGE